MTTTFRRRSTALVAATASLLAVSLLTATGAEAESVSLAGTAYPSTAYYTTPHYKAATGQARIAGVVYTPDTYCGGSGLATGMRQTVSPYHEVTQFPLSVPSASYRNVGAPPAYNTIFAAGTYYMNAAMVAAPNGCGSHWSGTLIW
jgi:hypothetical protein